VSARNQALASYAAKSRRPPLSAAASGFFAKWGPGFRQEPVVVEVAGIEPASFDASPGLLRAQSALPLLGPVDHADKST
jgi:hypothetical protein